jgi:hypothetical protein
MLQSTPSRQLRTQTSSGTPRQGRGAFASPSPTARGRSGGRKRSRSLSAVDLREHNRAEAARHPEVILARAQAFSKNSTARAEEQKNREAKEERWGHASGLRPPAKLVYVKVEVPVKAQRESVVPRTQVRSVDHLVSDADTEWLRSFVRTKAVTKEKTMFLPDFCTVFLKERTKELSTTQMSAVLHAAGIGYVKLKPGYYDVAWTDEWNLTRQRLVARVLWLLLRWPGDQIVVWNFDESTHHVHDYHNYGWCYLGVSNSDRVPFIRKGAKGARLNVSGFISREYGVLQTAAGEHVGAFEEKTNNTADSTAALFEIAAKIMSDRYPNKLHVIVTDGPRIHTMLDDDACNPNKINLSDGGTTRGSDCLFGENGLKTIYEEHYMEKHEKWLLKDYRADMWGKPEIAAQPLRLERILLKYGVLLLLNPVAHPLFAAIEQLWRDIKWDYRGN